MLWIIYLVNCFWFNLFFFPRAFLLLFQLTIAFLFCLTFSASMNVGEKLPTAVLKVILCGSIPVRAVFLSPGGRAGLEVETSLIFPRMHWPLSAWWLESTRWDKWPKGDTGCEVGLPLHSVAVTHLTGKEQKSWGSAELALLPLSGCISLYPHQDPCSTMRECWRSSTTGLMSATDRGPMPSWCRPPWLYPDRLGRKFLHFVSISPCPQFLPPLLCCGITRQAGRPPMDSWHALGAELWCSSHSQIFGLLLRCCLSKLQHLN